MNNSTQVIKILYRKIYLYLYFLKRNILSIDTILSKKYFNNSKITKLHMGCGDNILKSWLNSDMIPGGREVLYLNVTEKFPFEEAMFDYMYSEHMIEHITYQEGIIMLKESYRGLKVGGKIRITTPDMAFIIALYSKNKTDIQNSYINWAVDKYIPGNVPSYDTYVINNFMHNWGHQFIYDEKTLRFSMEKVGFKNITRTKINESTDKVFQNLENISKMPSGFLELESIILEGEK